LGNLSGLFFPWIVWSWEDATAATQQHTSKRFSCTGAQRAFAVEAFYKNYDSFMITQLEFRSRAVPSAHAIKTWVQNFEASGSTLKKKMVA
jgi:hypothetical protein